METTTNFTNNIQSRSTKKEWKEPTLILISQANIEKDAIATAEVGAPGVFTPVAQYHS